MEGFFFVIIFFVAFFAVVVVLAKVSAEKTREAWSSAARTLGIDFQPSGVFSHQRMEGALATGRVLVETFRRGSGKHSHTYTRYRAYYQEPLGLGLRLTREGFFSGLGRFLGAQDIQVGDAAFDNETVVKGQDPEKIVEFLTPARRLHIRRAFASFPGLTIDDREVCWESRGLHKDPGQIVSAAARLSQLAWKLGGRREEDQKLDVAMEAQREGRIDEALKALKEIPAAETIEPRVVEGEILYLAGRHEDAATAFRQALANAPDDEEIRRWAERVSGSEAPAGSSPGLREPSSPPPLPPAEPPVSRPVKPAAHEEAPVAFEPVSAPSPALDMATVCGELFSPGRSSLDASRILEERYQGKHVDWSGVLKNVESYSFDWIFGSDPGTKAILEIYEVPSHVYGHDFVQAVLQLKAGEDKPLRDCIGKTFSFEGTLWRADGLMRNLYLKDGSLRASGGGAG
jgi:tetratricopeptide (TPR) repeat protein